MPSIEISSTSSSSSTPSWVTPGSAASSTVRSRVGSVAVVVMTPPGDRLRRILAHGATSVHSAGVGTTESTEARVGRPRATTREEIERVAMRLFSTRGFDATTVDDIAAAAGIGRRAFFRYFAAKNDVVWGRFAEGLAGPRTALARAPDDRRVVESLHRAIVAFNALTPDQVPVHRQRMSLIFSAPSLQAHSTLMYASWRAVVADFVAGRVGVPVDDLLPQLVGHLTLGAAVAAYEQWLADADADLAQLLESSVGIAARGISAATRGRQSRGSATPARGSSE